MKLGNTLDGDDVAAMPLNLRTHLDKTFGKIDHLRFAGRILENCDALGQGRCHHQIFGARHRHNVHKNARTLQFADARNDIAGLNRDGGAHRF